MARCRLRHRRITQTVLACADPVSVIGVDPSDGFVAQAREQTRDARASFQSGKAEALPLANASVDVAVSGLVLNFVPHPAQAVAEMRRNLRPGGTAAVYVWDYAGEMQLMRHFWDAAVALNPAAGPLDEARRFPICKPERLQALFKHGGFDRIDAAASMCRRYSRTSMTTGRHSSVDRVRRRPIARRLPARSAPRCVKKSAQDCRSTATAPSR